MYISIWDLDWYFKNTNLPNVDCMRLSSYYKQKGYIINFITESFDLNIKYDKLYIFKENKTTPLPDAKYINDKNTILIGTGFEYLNSKSLGSVIIACRPDYLLYPAKKEIDSYYNANFITFYAGNKLIKNRQDFHNSKKYLKRTIITDKNFWKNSKENILYCLNELKKEKNIVFLNSISLKTLINEDDIRKNFLSLNFHTGTNFIWKNDLGNDYDSAEKIVSFLKELRLKTKSKLGFIPFKCILLNHFEDKTFYEIDLLRCFRIISLFKQNNFFCNFIVNTIDTPYVFYFRCIEEWTKYYFNLSFIEYCVHDQCYSSGILWNNIINNSIRWNNKKIDFLLKLLTKESWTEWHNLFYTQIKEQIINFNKIDFNYLKKNINLIEKD